MLTTLFIGFVLFAACWVVMQACDQDAVPDFVGCAVPSGFFLGILLMFVGMCGRVIQRINS